MTATVQHGTGTPPATAGGRQSKPQRCGQPTGPVACRPARPVDRCPTLGTARHVVPHRVTTQRPPAGGRRCSNPFSLADARATTPGSATARRHSWASLHQQPRVALPATVIPILFAAFAAYAFTFMEFRGQGRSSSSIIVSLLVVPIQVAFLPMLNMLGPRSLGINGSSSRRVARRTSGSACRWRSTSCATTWPRCRTAVIESAKIDGASHFQTFWRLICRCRSPRWRRSRSSSSSGSGTTCSSPCSSSSSENATVIVGSRAARRRGRAGAPPRRARHHDGRADARLPRPADASSSAA